MKRHSHIFLSFFLLIQIVFADERDYVWTYGYHTMERGEAEVEMYTTFTGPALSQFEGRVTVVHNLELEIGMNNRFDVGFYQTFTQKPNRSLEYSGFKVRTRYRFGEQNQYWMDPLLYVEYKGVPDFSTHELEVKGVFAKDFGRINLAVNPMVELEREADGPWEKSLKYAAGFHFQVNEILGFGIESQGSDNGHYLGPVITHGRDGLYMALGSGFAVTTIKNQKPKTLFRLIIGLEIG